MSYGIILLSCMLLGQKIAQCQSEAVISLLAEVAAATQASHHLSRVDSPTNSSSPTTEGNETATPDI